MSKKKKKLFLSAQDQQDVLNTIEKSFKYLDNDGKKTILKTIGITKVDIEKLDEDGLIQKVLSEYSKIISKIDLNDFKVDEKYKKANEYMSGDKKTEFKKEIKDYKNL
jgi:hypothetical protein